MIRDVGYLTHLDEIEILPGVAEAIRMFRERGLKVAVITNQSAVGRGYIKEEDLRRIHRELEDRLAASGARVDGFYYCPHHPTEALGNYRIACECRKPRVGLAERAAAELKLDLGCSYVVGDQATDMELAARVGARGILIQDRRQQSVTPGSLAVQSLREAADWIVEDFAARK